MSVHHIELPKPWDCQMEVLFDDSDGSLQGLGPQWYAKPSQLDEARMFRAVAFVMQLHQASERGFPIEKCIRHLRNEPDFACEFRLLKAVETCQSGVRFRLTKAALRKGAA